MVKLILAIILFVLIGFFVYQFVYQKDSIIPTVGKLKSEKIFAEEIPGSKFHSPDGTWWGYNQSKIVRFKTKVFTYVIENTDQDTKTTSKFTIYKKDGEKPWEKGASLPTSRPGNILIDSQGILHAFVFEPLDATVNDSRGSLVHYSFPEASEGNIIDYQKEIMIAGDPNNETVNIRVGADISSDDTMAVGFGLTKFNSLYKGQSEHLYFKKPHDPTWTHLIAGENLGHDWFYPFVLVGNNEFYLLPVQDDFTGQGNPNVYQKIMYFTYKKGSWEKELITDLSNHQLASKRPRLLEQEELFKDSSGRIHILYKEFLDPSSTWKTASHKHIIKVGKDTTTQTIDFGRDDINWIRLFEVENTLYYFLTTFDSFFIAKVGDDKLVQLPLPKGPQGTYPYIATAKSGVGDDEYFVDILLLAADQKIYSEGKQENYYVRIPKSTFIK